MKEPSTSDAHSDQSYKAGPLDYRAGSDEALIHRNTAAGPIERANATIGSELVGPAAEVVAKGVVRRHVAFEIAGVIDRGEHVDRGGHIDAGQRGCGLELIFHAGSMAAIRSGSVIPPAFERSGWET
jgi:hypothetical protein